VSPPCETGNPVSERLDARVGLICALAFVTFEAATPIQEWQRFVAYGVILVAAIALSRVKLVWILKRLALALPFVIAVAISAFMVKPSAEELVMVAGVRMSRPVLLLLGSVAAKATLSIGALSLVAGIWDVPTMLHAMQAIRVPRLFVMLMAFMWRYVYVLVDEARRMMQARDARGKQGSLWRRAVVVGAMTGSLFLRGYERAERVGQAMVARGYDGTIPLLTPLRKMRLVDAAAVVVAAGVLAAVRLAPIGGAWCRPL